MDKVGFSFAVHPEQVQIKPGVLRDLVIAAPLAFVRQATFFFARIRPSVVFTASQ